MSVPDLAPRVGGIPFVGSVFKMRSAPLKFLATARTLGDVVLIGRLPSSRIYLINNPDHIEDILTGNLSGVEMNRHSDVVRTVFGESMFTLSGEAWVARRRLVQPAFRPTQNPGFATIVAQLVSETISRWEHYSRDAREIDVTAEMMNLARRVIVKSMFGADLGEATYRLEDLFTLGMDYRHKRRWSIFRLPISWPTPRNLRFMRSLQRVEQIVNKIIRDRRDGGHGPGSLLSELMLACDPRTGNRLTDRQIRDEVMTMFTVGHLTTGAALSWALYEIMKRPDVAAKLREEFSVVLNGRIPSFHEIKNLPYTFRVVQETLRLYPPVWLISRRATKPLELGRHVIPPNSILLMSQYATHRHPDYWDRPDEFEPGRFTPNHVAARKKYAYFPFGGGRRQCIGADLSMIEALLIIPSLLQRFRLKLVSKASVAPWPLSTLLPHGPILAEVIEA